jgi:universal stress protein A
MEKYKNILVAVELIVKNDMLLIEHAGFLNKNLKNNVFLVHAVEHLGNYTAYGIGDIGEDIKKTAIESSTKEMKYLGDAIGIAKDKQITKIGSAKLVILEEARKIKAALIIIGSHGKSGLRAILGSTANAVLAVRLKDAH